MLARRNDLLAAIALHCSLNLILVVRMSETISIPDDLVILYPIWISSKFVEGSPASRRIDGRYVFTWSVVVFNFNAAESAILYIWASVVVPQLTSIRKNISLKLINKINK